MKCSRWVLGLLLIAGCGSDDTEVITPVADEASSESLPGTAAAVALDVAPPPEHDGTVVMVDGIPVEVVAHESGQVYAWMLGPEVPAEDRVELTVRVPTEGRETGRPVRLRFTEGQGRWVGRAGRLTIVPGPIDVVVVLDGEELHGHTDVFVVAPAVVVNVQVAQPAAQIIEVRHGKHKHRRRKHKHRSRGHGHGVNIRFGH